MYHLIRSFKDGGVETLVRKVVMNAPSNSTIIIASDEISDIGMQFLIDNKITFHVLKTKNIFQLLLSSKLWGYLFTRDKFTIWYDEMAIIAFMRFWGLTVVHVGIGLENSLKSSIYNFILKFISYIRPKIIVCASKQVRNSRKLSRKTRVLYNYVPIPNLTNNLQGFSDKKLLYVGRWELIKNVKISEEVLQNLGPDIELDVIGVQELGTRMSNINFLGPRNAPFDHPASCLLFFPHKVEGFGLILIEALTNGKKIITWDKYIAHELLKASDQVLFINPACLDIAEILRFLNKKNIQCDLELSLKYEPTKLAEFLECYG